MLPDFVVTSLAARVGLFVSREHWKGQADDCTIAWHVGYYGSSFYPKHSALVDRDPIRRVALFDFTRSFGFASNRRGFHAGELQGGFGTIAAISHRGQREAVNSGINVCGSKCLDSRRSRLPL